MAINQIQLPQLQRRIPDIAGQFIRGRQDKRAEDRQNRLLTIQEGNIGVQREQQEAQRVQAAKNEERAAAAEERRVQAEARAQSAEARKAGDAEQARKKSLGQAEATFWGRSADLLSKATPEELQTTWQTTIKAAIDAGIDIEDIPATVTPDIITAIRNKAALGGYKPAGSGGLASAKTEILADGSAIQALPSGEVQVRDPSGNIVTGKARLDALASSQEFKVKQTQRQAEATQRASRISEVTREMSERNRTSKRGAVNLAQAARLIESAEQGVSGASKVRLAKVFPGIDVSDEAALSQSLTNLALDQLQKFKGPTTDFEFSKTEEIAGTLGDSKTANRAKVASLQRNNWFTQRESKQFQDHVKAGKNPDTFGFDFNEQIKTKKGNFSLQDIQDTAVSNNITIEETLKRLDK